MADWIIGLIEQHGYLAIAALMLLENVFPPIPSELIMPFAGFVAARGDLSPAGVLLAGVCGSVLGTLPWYWAGQRVGNERLKRWAGRHGRWLTVSPGDLERGERWFAHHDAGAVLFGRLVPALRSVISAPAGVARMPFARFLLWTVLGTALWTATLASLGYLLDAGYERVSRWLDPVSTAIVVGAVLAYVWRVATFREHP